ncbi:MAG: hypothetical protein J5900_00590 [Prevotella sp.]|nr:hypothetical protein [Prevotella sp.]
MKDLFELAKHLLRTIVKGAAALFLFAFLPLLAVMCMTAACLYLSAAVIALFFASLTDEGDLSKFVFPRWSDRSKWIPQTKI